MSRPAAAAHGRPRTPARLPEWRGLQAAAAVPAARRLARELGVDLHRVTGTGPEGRIQPEDVAPLPQACHAQPQQRAGRAAAAAPAAAASPRGRSRCPARPAIRRLSPLTNIRRTIAERMTASVREAPQFTVSLDVDMTPRAGDRRGPAQGRCARRTTSHESR